MMTTSTILTVLVILAAVYIWFRLAWDVAADTNHDPMGRKRRARLAARQALITWTMVIGGFGLAILAGWATGTTDTPSADHAGGWMGICFGLPILVGFFASLIYIPNWIYVKRGLREEER